MQKFRTNFGSIRVRHRQAFLMVLRDKRRG
jgi:hypothetical protein